MTSASQIWSRASLCGVPGSGASNAAAQSSASNQTSDHGVVTVIPVVGGSSYILTAGSIADMSRADDFSRATSGASSAAAVAPSTTRSRMVQV